MSVRRSRTRVLALVPLALLSILGCETTQRRLEPPELRDDFGGALETEAITEESVSEGQMLHRRVQFEFKGGVSIPTGLVQSNDFDPGPSAGVKASIETVKNFYLGFGFDWANWNQSQGVGSLVGNPANLAGVSPDQLYDELNKFNLTLTGDYDWTLMKHTIGENMPLKLRLGAGIGAAIIQGEIDPFLERQFASVGSTVSIQSYVGFLARVATSLRWQLSDNVLVFGEAGWDFVTPFSTELRVNGSRSQVQGDIDFGAVTLGAGIAMEF